MNENVHKVCLASEYNFVRETMESKDVEDGVRLMSGKRAGSQTVEGIAYEFNPAKFTLGTALAWMESRGLDYGDVRAATPVAKFASGLKRFWFEACRIGKWKCVETLEGKPGRVEITRAMLKGAVDWIKSGKGCRGKLSHEENQTIAEELFGPDGLGSIVDARLRDDGVLELEASMPERTAKFVQQGLVRKPSVEIGANGELPFVAYLWNSQPAAGGLQPIQAKLAEAVETFIPPNTFGAPAFYTPQGLYLLAEAETEPGSPDATVGENSTGADTTSAPNQDAPERGQDMSEDLKPVLLKMAQGRIEDALGRAVAERRIEPGQIEGERATLNKLAEASITTPALVDALDGSLRALLARPQMPEKNQGHGDPQAPDPVKEDTRPATAKLADIAQKYVDDKIVSTYEDGWMRACRENPADYAAHNKATYKLRNSADEEVTV